MRRSSNIKKLFAGDSKIVLVEKLNNNFMGILNLSGGNQGGRGATGATGGYGFPGYRGPTGNTGIRGTRWFVGRVEPIGGPGDVIMPGDYWVNTDTPLNAIYEFTYDNGWEKSLYNLDAQSEFKIITGIDSYGGSTSADAIVYKNSPEDATFSFSDSTLNTENANPLHSAFQISYDDTRSGGFQLLEFSRGDLNDGSPSDYLNRPIFGFLNSVDDNSDLTLLTPGGSFTLQTIDPVGSGVIPYDIGINLDGNLNLQSATNTRIQTGNDATGGFRMISSGALRVTSLGYFKPDYYNLTHNTGVYNRPEFKSRIEINSQVSNVSPFKITSKLDTNVAGSGTLSVEISGGNDFIGDQAYKGDNYPLKISTYDASQVLTERFSVSSSGEIYSRKESREFTSLVKSSSNRNTVTAVEWYLLSNIDQFYDNRTVCFGADTNEIIIRPVGLANGLTFGVGLNFSTSDEISYLRNLKNVGETLKIKVRTGLNNIKIGAIGITNLRALNAAGGDANKYYPSTKVYNFTEGCTEVEFTIVKEVSGYTSAGDLVYFKGGGVSGFWTTAT